MGHVENLIGTTLFTNYLRNHFMVDCQVGPRSKSRGRGSGKALLRSKDASYVGQPSLELSHDILAHSSALIKSQHPSYSESHIILSPPVANWPAAMRIAMTFQLPDRFAPLLTHGGEAEQTSVAKSANFHWVADALRPT